MDLISEFRNQQSTSVLLVTLAAQGHINPMLRLGNCLASNGLHVTLATTEYALKNNRTATTACAGRVHLLFFSDGLPLDDDRRADTEFHMNSVRKFGPGNLSALIGSQSRKFSCIINNPFVPWAANVAEELGIPCAMLWIQPCTLYAIYYRYYNRLNEFPTESNPNLSVKLPGLPLLRSEELPSFVLPSNTFHSFHSLLKEVFQNMNKVKWVLGNSFMELEKEILQSMNDARRPFWPVGPIVPAELLGTKEELGGGDGGFDLFKSDEENDCLKWLDKQQHSSVVYISFGSLLFLSEEETESIAIGLKRTKRPFLWVIKPPENQEKLQFQFLEKLKDQGLIVRWCPQTQVLSHPSVGCFLSHCGWNSLLESLTAGVPVIAYPKLSDQPTNAKLVADIWRVGVKMTKNPDGVISGEEVESLVEEIMSGPSSQEYKKNAAELKMAARKAIADSGSSDKNMRLFVNEIISYC